MSQLTTKKYKIATIGSHTALQILKGAKDEGFETICVCTKNTRKMYESFGLADEIIVLDSYKDFPTIEDYLMEQNAIIIPHGSFVAYLGPDKVKELKVMHYGTKAILEWESDRVKEREWLTSAGVVMPRIFEKPEDIDTTVIIKFNGAGGGKDYFLANSKGDFYKQIEKYPDSASRGYTIQEYVVGVPIYAHFFYSRLHDRLEIMSFDKRYESNADSIGRISAHDQLETNIKTTYTITGNIPLVLRESLLPEVWGMGMKTVEKSREIVDGGLYGPFCLEMILDPDLKFHVFEISARIVAGTNPYIDGSPYTALRYNEPMSTGRRIARDIKEAIEQDRLDTILG